MADTQGLHTDDQTISGDAVLDALKMILIGAPLAEVLTSVTRLIETQRPGMLCSIFLLEEDGVHLRYAAAPSLPEFYLAATDGLASGPKAGACGTAVYRREAVFIADILTDPLWVRFRDVAASAGLRAAWSSPIISNDGRVLGTFGMYYREVRKPTSDDIRLIDHASRIAGIAIEREQSQAALKAAFEKLRNRKLICWSSSTQSVMMSSFWERTEAWSMSRTGSSRSIGT